MLRSSFFKNLSIKLGIALLLLQSFNVNAININEDVSFLQYIYNCTIAIQGKGTPTMDEFAQNAAGISGAVNAWRETVEQKGIQHAIDNIGTTIYKSPFFTATTVNPVEGLAAGITEAAQAQEHLTECITNGAGFNQIAAAATTANTYFYKTLKALQKLVKEFVAEWKEAWPRSSRRKQLNSLATACKESWSCITKAASTAKNCIKNEACAALAFCKAHPALTAVVLVIAGRVIYEMCKGNKKEDQRN